LGYGDDPEHRAYFNVANRCFNRTTSQDIR
jgi:hypothetical protein